MTVSSKSSTWLDKLPEPDPFSPEEFGAWRGLLRLRETVTREVDRRLRESAGLSIDDYGNVIIQIAADDPEEVSA